MVMKLYLIILLLIEVVLTIISLMLLNVQKKKKLNIIENVFSYFTFICLIIVTMILEIYNIGFLSKKDNVGYIILLTYIIPLPLYFMFKKHIDRLNKIWKIIIIIVIIIINTYLFMMWNTR